MNPDELYTVVYVMMDPLPDLRALSVADYKRLRDLGYFG